MSEALRARPRRRPACRGRAGRGHALGRSRLDLPAGRGGHAVRPRAGDRSARGPRAAAGAGRGGRSSARRCAAAGRAAGGRPRGAGAADGNVHAWAREARYAAAAPATGGAGSRRATRPPTRPRPSSIASRLAGPPGAAGDDGRGACRAAAAGRRAGSRPVPIARRAACPGSRTRPTTDRVSRARVYETPTPALRDVHPAAEANVVRTAALLREEAEVLDALVARRSAGDRSGARASGVLPPALARLMMRRLAEDATAGSAPCGGRPDDVLDLASRRAGPGRRRPGPGPRRRAVFRAPSAGA